MRRRTITQNATWIRHWAWAISLVLALFGTLLVYPLVTSSFGVWFLTGFPLGWLLIYATVRLAAKHVPDMLFPGEE